MGLEMSAAGLLGILVVKELAEVTAPRWARTAARLLYLPAIPFLVMFVIAALARASEIAAG